MDKVKEARLRKMVEVTEVTHALLTHNGIKFLKDDIIKFGLKSLTRVVDKEQVIEAEELFRRQHKYLLNEYQLVDVNPLLHLYFESPKCLSDAGGVWEDIGLTLVRTYGRFNEIIDTAYQLNSGDELLVTDMTDGRVVTVKYLLDTELNFNLLLSGEDTVFKARAKQSFSTGYRTTLAEAILASLGSEFTLTRTTSDTEEDYVLTCDRRGKLYAEMQLPELKTIKSIKAGRLAITDIAKLVKEIKTESHARLYDRFLAMLFNTGYNVEVEKNKLYLPESEEAAFTWKGDFVLLYKLNELEPDTKVYWTPNSIMVRDGLEIRNNAKRVTIVYSGYRVEVEDEQKH